MESDLRQVGQRRQICPQICILHYRQWQPVACLTDTPKVIPFLPIALIEQVASVALSAE